jgi:hypothetical protein
MSVKNKGKPHFVNITKSMLYKIKVLKMKKRIKKVEE